MRRKIRIADRGSRNCPAQRLLRTFIPQSEIRIPNSPPRGISLIEILVSIFVLLFGLMGVAAIFPVGNFYVVEGEKFDLGSSLAQNAFEEIAARGMLRPRAWLYANTPPGMAIVNPFVIQPKGLGFAAPNPDMFNESFPTGPGHAFVIDPLSTAIAIASGALTNLDVWPLEQSPGVFNTAMPTVWSTPAAPRIPLNNAGTRWPVRRITLPQATGIPLSTAVAETIFRLRDDLSVTQPKEDDRPSIQNWDLDTTSAIPTLLRRQYKGDYSWLATVVPTSAESLAAFQPAVPTNDYGEQRYDVSVVVFRKREETPSATSERLIQAEFINEGEIAIYAANAALVDAAVDEIRPGNWIAVAGVNQTTGDFMMKWYRILSKDQETTSGFTLPFAGANQQVRFLTLDGPDWPLDSYADLRAILLPGAISVATQQLHMKD